MRRWKHSAHPWLPLFVLLAILAAACGCDAADEAGERPSVATSVRPALPTSVTTAGAGETASLDGTALVAVHTLPAAALSADALAPAGRGEAADGGSLDFARTSAAGVEAWELVSAAADGWRIWRPAILDEVLADAGAGATVIEVTDEEWPDSCLGLARQDEVCLTVITPGFRVIIEQGGRRIEYHTARVSVFRAAP